MIEKFNKKGWRILNRLGKKGDMDERLLMENDKDDYDVFSLMT